jgi:Beta-propeller repeat
MDEELELFSVQVYTPGSDIATGFKPSQIIWGRTGNDVVVGNQPPTTIPNQTRIDILLGDVAIDDPAFRQWNDTFILGDWQQSYYANSNSGNLGLNSFAFVPDFNPMVDTLQLRGAANNYQLLNTGLGTAIVELQPTGVPDVVGFLLGNSNLSLGSNYFNFQGVTPPTGPVIPQARQLGTPGYDIPLGISNDPFGNVYIGGGTTGSLGGPNAGLRDALVVKYNNQGNQLFTKQFGTSAFDTIYGIGTDNQGNVYVGGTTEGNLFGPKQAQSTDSFVAKYDPNGNPLWTQQVSQEDSTIFNAFNLAVDKNTGDVYLSGANVKTSFLENPDDAFLIKFDTNGDEQWRTETGTTGFLAFDEPYGVTVANDGSVYATGWTASNLGGPNAGLYDNWIAKYDQNTGEEQWVTQYGTPDYEWSWDVDTDSLGNVYTTGWTLGDLGGPNLGSFDAYLTKSDSEGNLLWTKQFGSVGDDEAYDMFINSDGIFLAGYTDGNFGGTNAGSFDAWLAKFNFDGNELWRQQFGTFDRDEVYGITGDALGNLFVTGITKGSLGDTNQGSFDTWLAKLSAETGELLNLSGTSSGQHQETGADSSQTNQKQQLSAEQEEYIANFFNTFSTKTLGLSSGSGGPKGTGLANLVNNPYNQPIPTPIPEPSSAVSLIMFGAVCMWWISKVGKRA